MIETLTLLILESQMKLPEWHEIIDHILELLESQTQQHDELLEGDDDVFSEAA